MTCKQSDAPDECGCTLELIWDEGLNATALTGASSSICVGPAMNLLPHHLLALAASSSLMTAFLDLAGAARVPVQGYVSSARLDYRGDGDPELALAPCVVVSSQDDAQCVAKLWPEAVERSPALRILRHRLRVEPTVRVAAPV